MRGTVIALVALTFVGFLTLTLVVWRLVRRRWAAKPSAIGAILERMTLDDHRIPAGHGNEEGRDDHGRGEAERSGVPSADR